MSKAPIKIAVLVSGQGRGSNMQAIINACKSDKINGEVALVIGSKDSAPAMERARIAGIKTLAIPLDTWDYEDIVLAALGDDNIDLICLAGYMRVLETSIIDRYRGRIINVHPALIPSFCGKGMYGHYVHEAVIKRGVKFTGATIHLVDEDYDTGPIILQSIVPVDENDTPDTIAAKVLKHEHQAYTEAIALFAEGRIEVIDRKVRILPKE